MKVNEIQQLNLGDKVKYHNYILEIVDWKCHKDIIMFGNERIWAEPIFKWSDILSPQTKLQNRSINPSFWNEIEILT